MENSNRRSGGGGGGGGDDTANGLLSSPLPLYEYTAGETPEDARTEIPPPQTGTTLPFIWPPPVHLQTPPPFEEPVLPCPPSESLLARETKLDALRCEDPSSHQGRQVYESLDPPPRDNYNGARGATSAEDMPQWYVPQGRADDTIVFESRFESGNLRSAERIDESEYNLQLAFDINTERHTQWFYFRMTNLRKGRSYKLNMQNLMKPHAMYNLGMQPLAYSEVRAEKEGVGWYRTGSDACYFKNQIMRAGVKPFWTLTFVIGTMYDKDTLYLAHCFPYRYTDLQRYLREKEALRLPPSVAIRRRTLCKTLAGNDCDMLTITSPSGDHVKKKGVVISARVHPGETNASWMMKGVLDYLTSDCPQAIALREKLVFKIVPMLNPDGVIVGNQRCSLAAGDLNRQYEDPKRELFPEVLNLKQLISNFGMGKEVLLYVDLHGHSKKNNMFMYGVQNPTDETLYMRERVIPTLLDRASPLFSLENCTFDVGKGKEGCGRVVARKQLGIVNAYTMEASFMGADQGEFGGIHFNQGHYESMGHSLCEAIVDLVDPDQSKVESIVRNLIEKYPIDQSRVIPKRDFDGDGGSTSDDSNTDVPPRLSAKPPPKPPKHGVRKTRTDAGSVGPGTKTTPRERDSVRGVNSSSEGENNNDVKADSRKGSKVTRSNAQEQPKKQPKPTPIAPPAEAAPAPSACDSGTVPSSQNSPPPKPPATKAARPGGSATKTVVSNTGTSRGGTRKSVTSKTSTMSGKKADAKSRRVKPKGTGVAARKGDSAPKDTAVGVDVAAPKVSHNVCLAARGDGTVGDSGEKPVPGDGTKSVATKRSKAGPIPASRMGKGGVTTKKKAEKRGATSGRRVAPGHGPVRRPASTPASRSVDSPRRHSAAIAWRRSPSAPPNSVAASRRAGATVGAAEESKAGGEEGAAGAPTEKLTSGQRKGKKGRKKEELPVPPLRSLLSAKKNGAS